jgi:hypothetical protein
LGTISPSVILSMILPWFDLFQRLNIIHSQWRPELDYAANAFSTVSALFYYFITKTLDDQRLIVHITVTFIFIFVFFFLAFFVGRFLIYLFPVELLFFANLLWGGFYLLAFISLTCFLIGITKLIIKSQNN